ncbi:MAG: DUF5345 family protein [Clostridia bacterium]|nr:DUF5345 family protein [Clostridia bacterium]
MNDNEKIAQDIKKSLDYMDQSMEVNIPHINRFKNLVAEVEEKKKAKRKKETVLFLAVIIGVFMIETVSIWVFAVIQALAVLLIPIWFFFIKKGKHNEAGGV